MQPGRYVKGETAASGDATLLAQQLSGEYVENLAHFMSSVVPR